MDKKTLCTLREELVQEKVRSQQLSAQLEQLNGELQRVGIDRERLAASDYSAGERSVVQWSLPASGAEGALQ